MLRNGGQLWNKVRPRHCQLDTPDYISMMSEVALKLCSLIFRNVLQIAKIFSIGHSD